MERQPALGWSVEDTAAGPASAKGRDLGVWACPSWPRWGWGPSERPRWPGGPGGCASSSVSPPTRAGRHPPLRKPPSTPTSCWRASPGLPPLRAFETANCALGSALAREGAVTPRVRIRAICVGAAGVDFWIAGPPRPAPDGFTISPRAATPGMPRTTPSPRPIAARPMLPIVLPVGEDDSGTWLVPLGPGDCLPLDGRGAGELWRAARAVQESWSWADMVLVTDDPDGRGRGGAPAGRGTRREVLFSGDPASLSPALAQAVSVVIPVARTGQRCDRAG